jgi:DNA polymerase III epsilon subunit-like protein
MLQWFKKTGSKLPEFWENYLAHFQEKSVSNKYVVFDCETTGLNPRKDVVLSIGAVVIEDNTISISKSFVLASFSISCILEITSLGAFSKKALFSIFKLVDSIVFKSFCF